jgi:hypothetical protein
MTLAKEYLEEFLGANDGKVVKMRLADGEEITAKVHWFKWEYEDVVVDILTTTTPERYERDISKTPYTIGFDTIAEVSANED